MKIRQYIFQQMIRYFRHADSVPFSENNFSFEYLCSTINNGEEFEFKYQGKIYEIVQYTDKIELYEDTGDSQHKIIYTFTSVDDFRFNCRINGENLCEAWTKRYLESHPDEL